MQARARFDVTRVRLRQFRSIGACDVSLGPLTLLAGPNGAGKSNFLDALRFVSDALNETLDNALRDRGGASSVRRRSTGHPTHFGITLDLAGPGFVAEYGFAVGAVKGGDFRVTDETCRVRRTEFGAEDAYYSVRNGKVESSGQVRLPRPADDRLFLVAASGLDEFRPVFDGLTALNVFSINPDALRALQRPVSGEVLRRDGSNAASVLERLRRNEPDTKRRVEEYLARVVPGIVSVDHEAVSAWETLTFRQETAGSSSPWQFPATAMSDGTLRALGALLGLFGGGGPMASPVGIEEPEAALHPAAAGLLLEIMRDASSSRQVLATSHSPDLLDTHDIEADEVLAVRSVAGQTRIGRLDPVGSRSMAENLFTPGELLRTDQLQPELHPQPQEALFP